jgi:glycosyltransferase involved in cell wall biosynthesis
MFATVFLADLSASVCWTVRTSNLGRRSKIHSWLLVYLLGLLSWFFPASIIYCSKQALIWHRKYAFWKNGVVVLNGVRPGVGGKRPQYRVLLPRNPVKVAVIARLDDQKGQRWLLGNLEEISTKNYEVVFYGRGVSSLVPEYGHLANVGLYEGRDSYSILPGCDVLLMPSLYGEGYPNIVAEALCTGVYVIAAETGSVDEFNLADDQMFPPGDFRALSRCLDGFRRMDLDLIDRRVQYQSNHISSQHVRSLQIQLFRKYASQK